MGLTLTDDVLALVAERFQALAEPARLQILNALREGERSVSELVEATGQGQANVSKHLQLLFALDFVERRREGSFVYYRLADERVFQLCDLVCDGIAQAHEERARLLGG